MLKVLVRWKRCYRRGSEVMPSLMVQICEFVEEKKTKNRVEIIDYVRNFAADVYNFFFAKNFSFLNSFFISDSCLR